MRNSGKPAANLWSCDGDECAGIATAYSDLRRDAAMSTRGRSYQYEHCGRMRKTTRSQSQAIGVRERRPRET